MNSPSFVGKKKNAKKIWQCPPYTINLMLQQRIMNTDNLWPSAIEIKGLPFMFQGWNAILRLDIQENQGVYRMDPYRLFCLIPIAGITLRRHRDGIWRLFKDESDWLPASMHNPSGPPIPIAKIGPDQSSPLGLWSFGFRNFEIVECPR